MKNIIHMIPKAWIKSALILVIVSFTGFSCDEQEFLETTPVDFYAPENSFVTFADFESAVYNLHYRYRDLMWRNNNPRFYWDQTDMILTFYAIQGNRDVRSMWGPSHRNNLRLWEDCYEIIYDSNVILGRSEEESAVLTSEERQIVQAEAYFFRGIAYKLLGNMYGGVPIILEEVKAPIRDFVRATRQEVYEQSANDLSIASTDLPDIDEANDSRINNLVASHFLAEVYASLERWSDAITAASRVIDHSSTALMTSRFGSRMDEPGDVYWDLFRQGNQNRASGNTEALWVLPFEYNLPGGGGNNGYILERIVGPILRSAMIEQSDGSLSPVLAQPNTFVAGRGAGFSAPSPYFQNELWQKSGFNQDIRNSSFNIQRDVQVRNPDNEYNGQWVIADNLPLKRVTVTDTARFFYPIISKVTTPGRHPAEFFLADQTVPGSLTVAAARTWRDHYELRLAETYLVRAEAHMGNGDQSSAAADINVVRNRAQAPDVNPGEVDMDYILDERMRELHYEKWRLIELMRVGKAVERIKTLNPVVGATVGDHQDLMAIPISEIQKNVEAELTQNPGY